MQQPEIGNGLLETLTLWNALTLAYPSDPDDAVEVSEQSRSRASQGKHFLTRTKGGYRFGNIGRRCSSNGVGDGGGQRRFNDAAL